MKGGELPGRKKFQPGSFVKDIIVATRTAMASGLALEMAVERMADAIPALGCFGSFWPIKGDIPSRTCEKNRVRTQWKSPLHLPNQPGILRFWGVTSTETFWANGTTCSFTSPFSAGGLSSVS